ncbi:MAG: trypsin-like peptidase domain-containing protein [Elusimicrobia bacterium]|nr:trypsin-like peptidase domain-containing protein [Elusimicrobiota bacterium]
MVKFLKLDWFIFLILLCFYSNLVTSSEIPDTILKSAVYIECYSVVNGVGCSSPLGSGFLFNKNEHKPAYIITAKHVLINPETGKLNSEKIRCTCFTKGFKEEIPVICIIDLNQIIKDKNIYLSSNDVATIKLAETDEKDKKIKHISEGIKFLNDTTSMPFNEDRPFLVVGNEGVKLFNDVELTTDVIFLGFPMSLNLNKQLSGNQLLCSKGIVAGKNEINKTIIIDKGVYHGNSGCPVFAFTKNFFAIPSGFREETKFFFIGIVTEYIPYIENNLIKSKISISSSTYSIGNAGYSVVEPYDTIIDIIEKSENK